MYSSSIKGLGGGGGTLDIFLGASTIGHFVTTYIPRQDTCSKHQHTAAQEDMHLLPPIFDVSNTATCRCRSTCVHSWAAVSS